MNASFDITMCVNRNCDKRIECVRAEESGTKPHPSHQSYCEFNPENNKRCKEYWSKKLL